MERTIERTEILLSSNPASKQAASAIHYTNGNFRIEWFASVGAAFENLATQLASYVGEIHTPRLRRLPQAQV